MSLNADVRKFIDNPTPQNAFDVWSKHKKNVSFRSIWPEQAEEIERIVNRENRKEARKYYEVSAFHVPLTANNKLLPSGVKNLGGYAESGWYWTKVNDNGNRVGKAFGPFLSEHDALDAGEAGIKTQKEFDAYEDERDFQDWSQDVFPEGR